MFVKTVLHAGDFMTVVPLGLPVTLQYNEKGILEKVYKGYDQSRVNISDDVLSAVFKNNIAPIRVSAYGGTTWVYGVIHSRFRCYATGNLPDAIVPELIEAINKSPDKFRFWAGNVDSNALGFRGAVAVRNWLTACKFNVLPGWIVPHTFDRSWFVQATKSSFFTDHPRIMGYMLFRGDEVLYQYTGIHQFTVTKVVKVLDESGKICGLVYGSDKFPSGFRLNYSDVVKHNILPNTSILLDHNNSILCTSTTDNKVRESRSADLVCSVCGRPFKCPESGEVTCPDPDCPSKLFPVITQFLTTLNLPLMTYDKFDSLIKNKEILCLSDILLLPEYKEIEINVTISKFLAAIVPTTCVANSDVFSVFANHCKNSVETLQYYFNHTDLLYPIVSKFGVQGQRFTEWLSRPSNRLTLLAFVDCPNLHFTEVGKLFDGAPIFRDRSIMITGKFKHGGTDKIVSILKSYGATVTTDYTSATSCVVVGDLLEDVNSSAIRQAQSAGISVFKECEFFDRFDIDSDLAENL